MIWIASLCLLAVIAWLFLNALNERRWVQAHSHDESVAADKGFLPDFSNLTARMKADADGRVSLDHEDTRFARAVKKVQEKGAGLSERIERKAEEGRSREDGDTFFGRMVEKIGGAANRLDEKLDERAKRQASGEKRTVAEEGSLFGRATAGVARKQEEYGGRVRERVTRRAATDQPTGQIGEEGYFGRMVDKVSGRLDKVERKLDDQAAKARGDRAAPAPVVGNGDEKEDFLIRASRRIGTRINEIDEKIVDKSKTASDKIDKKMLP